MTLWCVEAQVDETAQQLSAQILATTVSKHMESTNNINSASLIVQWRPSLPRWWRWSSPLQASKLFGPHPRLEVNEPQHFNHRGQKAAHLMSASLLDHKVKTTPVHLQSSFVLHCSVWWGKKNKKKKQTLWKIHGCQTPNTGVQLDILEMWGFHSTTAICLSCRQSLLSFYLPFGENSAALFCTDECGF